MSQEDAESLDALRELSESEEHELYTNLGRHYRKGHAVYSAILTPGIPSLQDLCHMKLMHQDDFEKSLKDLLHHKMPDMSLPKTTLKEFPPFVCTTFMLMVNVRLITADSYYDRIRMDEWEFERLAIPTGTPYGSAPGLLVRYVRRRKGEIKDEFCSTIVAPFPPEPEVVRDLLQRHLLGGIIREQFRPFMTAHPGKPIASTISVHMGCCINLEPFTRSTFRFYHPVIAEDMLRDLMWHITLIKMDMTDVENVAGTIYHPVRKTLYKLREIFGNLSDAKILQDPTLWFGSARLARKKFSIYPDLINNYEKNISRNICIEMQKII